MSDIEQGLRSLLARRPEIEKCSRLGLLNRRALARFLIRQGIAESDQMEAVVATVRRFDFGEGEKEPVDLFRDIRVTLKDKILILDFPKQKELLKRLERVIAQTDYDRGDTLKVVVGTASLKLFIDRRMERSLGFLFDQFNVRARFDHVTEISLQFPEAAVRTPSVISVLARELALNDIVITEMLTASPELLLYLKDPYVPAAYDVVRRLQQPPPARPGRRTRRGTRWAGVAGPSTVGD